MEKATHYRAWKKTQKTVDLRMQSRKLLRSIRKSHAMLFLCGLWLCKHLFCSGGLSLFILHSSILSLSLYLSIYLSIYLSPFLSFSLSPIALALCVFLLVLYLSLCVLSLRVSLCLDLFPPTHTHTHTHTTQHNWTLLTKQPKKTANPRDVQQTWTCRAGSGGGLRIPRARRGIVRDTRPVTAVSTPPFWRADGFPSVLLIPLLPCSSFIHVPSKTNKNSLGFWAQKWSGLDFNMCISFDGFRW